MPVKSGKAPPVSWLNSNQQEIREELQYSYEDIAHIEEWTKVRSSHTLACATDDADCDIAPRRDHMAQPGNLLHGPQGG